MKKIMNKINSYPLSYNTWNGLENNAIIKLLKTGKLTYGKNTKNF